jgi:hypothetical protein
MHHSNATKQTENHALPLMHMFCLLACWHHFRKQLGDKTDIIQLICNSILLTSQLAQTPCCHHHPATDLAFTIIQPSGLAAVITAYHVRKQRSIFSLATCPILNMLIHQLSAREPA